MPGRGGSGRRQAFFSYSPTLKIVRILLEKCIPTPLALTKQWYMDDDFDAAWNLNYHSTSAPPPRNEHIRSIDPYKTTTKENVDDPPPSTKLVLSSECSEKTSVSTVTDAVSDDHRFVPRGVSAEAREWQARFDTQFGPIGSHDHQYISKHMGGEHPEHIVDDPPYLFIITIQIGFSILIAFGRVRDFFGVRFRRNSYRHITDSNGYAALNSDWTNFYFRRLKMRMNDCFSRPTTGVPGRYITLMDRTTNDSNLHFQYTGTYTETLNMSSYNYLGFAQSEGPCADDVEECIKQYGISSTSPRADSGTSDLTIEVERKTAEFIGMPDAMIFSMGFVTNATSFSVLVGKGCLIISDEYNHTSIRVGAQASGATIRSNKHNDLKMLEKTLRDAISKGQPKTASFQPWRKILVVIEGLYSMEGTVPDLPGLLRLKKKYKFYLFIDEAHSIGAIGPRGRGICDFFNIDPSEVDILMGTFTKAFGANGGYIAASKAVISIFRKTNGAMLYAESPTPPVLMQILSSLRIIAGETVPGQGEERIQRIAWNSRYLRLGLKRLGFIVYGHDDSPVVPLILYHAGKLPAFSHEMLRRKISIVIAGYPATPLLSARARLCVSAAHNKADMDRLLTACDEVGDLLDLKVSSGKAGRTETISDDEEESHQDRLVVPPRWTLKEVLAHGERDVKMRFRPGSA